MIERFPKSEGEKPALDQLKNELRDHIRKTVIKIGELAPKAIKAKEDAWGKIQEAMQQGLEGEPWRDDFIMHPNDKGRFSLMELSEGIQKEVWAHGVASNLPTQERDFAIKALVQILATGVLKGDTAPLSGAIPVFTNAPFVLLSNRGEQLIEDGPDGLPRIKSLRTVLVNGEYEDIVDDLRKAFPWVSFRTADQINDAVFDKKDGPYRSYEDRIDEEARKRRAGRNG